MPRQPHLDYLTPPELASREAIGRQMADLRRQLAALQRRWKVINDRGYARHYKDIRENA